MPNTATVNVSFPRRLLNVMDRTAKQETRSRSELLRTAVAMYLEQKQRWQKIFAYGERQAKKLGLKPEDVNRLVAEHRREKTGRTH